LGITALAYASLIGISTLYIKQHYVIDCRRWRLSAYLAYLVFLRRYARDAVAAATAVARLLRVLPQSECLGLWSPSSGSRTIFARADVQPRRKAMGQSFRNL